MADIIQVISGESTATYNDLTSAVAAIQPGDTAILLQDVSTSLNNVLVKDKEFTFDLNGHSYTTPNSPFLLVGTSNVVIKDSSEAHTGVFKSNSNGIMLGATGEYYKQESKITLDSGTIEAQEFGICIFGCSSIIVNGGKIISHDNAAVGCNGSLKYSEYPCSIIINGGELIAETQSAGYANCGLYAANSGNYRINGGTITGVDGAGIVLRAGNLVVSGGEIYGKGNSSGLKMGDAAPTYCGGIEICNATNYPGKMGTCIVVEGTISSSHNAAILAIGNPADYLNAENSATLLYGGTFNGYPAVNYVTKEGEEIEDKSTSKVAVDGGDYSTNVAKFLSYQVALKRVVDDDGNISYTARDEIGELINNTEVILDVTECIDDRTFEIDKLTAQINGKLLDIKDSIEVLDERESQIASDTSDIKDAVTTGFETVEAKQDLQNQNLEISNGLISEIQDSAQEIESNSNSIKSNTASLVHSNDQISANTHTIDVQVTEVLGEAARLVELNKKLLIEVAKIAGDDPSTIIDDDTPQSLESIYLLMIKTLINRAKVLDHKKVIWQHPMNDIVRDYVVTQGYEMIPYIGTYVPARIGDQWLIILEK